MTKIIIAASKTEHRMRNLLKLLKWQTNHIHNNTTIDNTQPLRHLCFNQINSRWFKLYDYLLFHFCKMKLLSQKWFGFVSLFYFYFYRFLFAIHLYPLTMPIQVKCFMKLHMELISWNHSRAHVNRIEMKRRIELVTAL